MDTRFIIPVAVAAAIHAGALFGVTWPKHNEPKKTTTVFVPPDHVVTVDIPEPQLTDPVDAAPQGAPDTAPRSPDLLRPDPSGFKQIVVPSAPSKLSALPTIPLQPMGLENADPNSTIGVGPGIFSPSALDATPRTRSQVPPVYPQEARNDGVSAEIMVEFVVDETGRVLNPHIVRSSDRRFDDATLRAVTKWRFEPGRVKGQAVRFRMMAPVVFSLQT